MDIEARLAFSSQSGYCLDLNLLNGTFLSQTDLSDEESGKTGQPAIMVTSADWNSETPSSTPRSSILYTIPVSVPPEERKKKVSQVSRKSLASLMDIDDHTRPQPRYSVPFLCKSDLSTLKERSTAAITEKRKSIIMERKISRQHSSGSESDEELHVKKLSVTSLPGDTDSSKRTYSRLSSINDALTEISEEAGSESKKHLNGDVSDDKTPSDHL